MTCSDGPQTAWSPPDAITVVVLVAAIALLWWSPFDHPLYPPDEGRYGSVAATMVETGDWIVPSFRGEPHLTKPPLTYWLQGVGVFLVGRSEIAVRVPALVASSLVVLLLFAFTTALRGRAAGLCAAAVYVVMPEAIIVSRLGSTDVILNLFWTVALGAGALAVQQGDGRGSGRWAIVFWLATGLAGLTKGPLAAAPFCILLAWCVLAGRWRAMLRLRPLIGAPLALLPLAAWLFAVGWRDSDIFAIWVRETVGRATGSLGKRDVWWFYIPLYLVGFFPATAMLVVPGVNLPWREAWSRLRNGSVESLAIIAVIAPLMAFSLSKGKLPTYLLPLAAPTAFLCGTTLAGWLSGRFDRVQEGFRPPDVRWTLLACYSVALTAAFVGRAMFAERLTAVPVEAWSARFLLLMPLAGVAWLAIRWRPVSARRPAMLLAWIAVLGGWVGCFSIEDRVNEPQSGQLVAAAVRDALSAGGSGTSGAVDSAARVVWVGKPDQTMRFYLNDRIEDLGDEPPDDALEKALESAEIAIVDSRVWDHLSSRGSTVLRRLEFVSQKRLFFNRTVVVCRVHGPR